MLAFFVEDFVETFSFYEGTFDLCYDNLAKVFHRCEEVNLVPNWEKCYFMVQ